MKKQLFIVLSIVGFSTMAFTQNQNTDSNNTNSAAGTAHAGISFNIPAGSWVDVPSNESLFPNMQNKIQEKTEKDKKITIAYQTQGSYADLLSLFDQTKSIFRITWDDLTVVEPLKLISPMDSVGGPRKFSAVYRVIEKSTQTVFRVEVVVVTSFNMVGNKGVVYIVCPDYNYYENRFVIASIRNALTLDINAIKQNPKA